MNTTSVLEFVNSSRAFHKSVDNSMEPIYKVVVKGVKHLIPQHTILCSNGLLKCSYCWHIVRHDDCYCSYCGHKLK